MLTTGRLEVHQLKLGITMLRKLYLDHSITQADLKSCRQDRVQSPIFKSKFSSRIMAQFGTRFHVSPSRSWRWTLGNSWQWKQRIISPLKGEANPCGALLAPKTYKVTRAPRFGPSTLLTLASCPTFDYWDPRKPCVVTQNSWELMSHNPH